MATIRANVIVGIVDSLAGLRAVREAVSLARCRRAQLIAIKTYTEPLYDSTPFHGLLATSQLYGIGLHGDDTIAHEEIEQRQRIAESNALGEMRQTFETALGEVPRNIPMRLMTTTSKLDAAIISVVHDDRDVIVLPIDNVPPRRFNKRAARLGCLVLLVPPHELAHKVHRWHHLNPESLIAAHGKADPH